MKIKGVVKNLNFYKILKHDNNEDILTNFSGAVMGSVGSVQFQIAPCFSFHLVSRSMLLLLMLSCFSHVQLCVTP